MAIGYVRVSEVCKVVEVLTHCTLEINLDLNEFIVYNTKTWSSFHGNNGGGLLKFWNVLDR